MSAPPDRSVLTKPNDKDDEPDIVLARYISIIPAEERGIEGVWLTASCSFKCKLTYPSSCLRCCKPCMASVSLFSEIPNAFSSYTFVARIANAIGYMANIIFKQSSADV